MKFNIYVILYLLCASVVSGQYAEAAQRVNEQEQSKIDIVYFVGQCQKIALKVWIDHKLRMYMYNGTIINKKFDEDLVNRLLDTAYNNVDIEENENIIKPLCYTIDGSGLRSPTNETLKFIVTLEQGIDAYDYSEDMLSKLNLFEIRCAKLLCKVAYDMSKNNANIKKSLDFITELESKKLQQMEIMTKDNVDFQMKSVKEIQPEDISLSHNINNSSITLSGEDIIIPDNVQDIDDRTFDNVTISKLSVEKQSNQYMSEESENTEDIDDDSSFDESQDKVIISQDGNNEQEQTFSARSTNVANHGQVIDGSNTSEPVDLSSIIRNLKSATTKIVSEEETRRSRRVEQHDWRKTLKRTGRLDNFETQE